MRNIGRNRINSKGIDQLFNPFIAPSTFDRTAQEIDIFSVYNNTDSTDKKWVSSISSAVSSTILYSGTGISWYYGEYVGGADVYYSMTSGTVTWTTGSTRRWIMLLSTQAYTEATIPVGAVWTYLGSGIVKVSRVGTNTYWRYIHSYGFITGIAPIAFQACTSLTGNADLSHVTDVIQNNAFQNCTLITGDLILNSGVTGIASAAFYNTRFSTVSLPSTLTSIAAQAFYGNTNLTSIILPSSITTIGANAFQNCTALNTITINCVSATFTTPFAGCTAVVNLNLAANYSSSYLDFSFSSNLAAAPLYVSLSNVTAGTSGTPKTVTIGTTNKTRLIAAYPNVESELAAKYITLV